MLRLIFCFSAVFTQFAVFFGACRVFVVGIEFGMRIPRVKTLFSNSSAQSVTFPRFKGFRSELCGCHFYGVQYIHYGIIGFSM